MSRSSHQGLGTVVVGVGLLILGALFLMDKMGSLDVRDFFQYWPLILIGVGLTRLGSRQAADIGFMIGMVGLGTWFLLYNLDFIDFNPFDMFWPLVLILAGGAIVLSALRNRTEPIPQTGDGEYINMLNTLSSSRRRVAHNNFRGGEMTAVMGGGELDLTEAGIDGDEAVIRVFVMMAGYKIRVPRDWHVANDIVPILGGVEDKTRPPHGTSGPRLVLKGWAFLGGLEIQN